MTNYKTLFIVVISALVGVVVLAGCEDTVGGKDDDGGPAARQSGPHESERGLVTYWRVTGSSSTVEACTDSADFASAVIPPDFSDNSFLMYMVQSDGVSAISQDCDTTNASSCTADTDAVWSISGNTLSYSSGDFTIQGTADCELVQHADWTLEDNGATAAWSVVISYEYDSEEAACGALEDSIIADAANGLGFENCIITNDVQLAFEKAEAP